MTQMAWPTYGEAPLPRLRLTWTGAMARLVPGLVASVVVARTTPLITNSTSMPAGITESRTPVMTVMT